MSNQPFLYDPKANVLRKRAGMEKPSTIEYDRTDGAGVRFWDKSSFYRDLEKYRDHIASLPAYTPVSGWVPEVGKEYIEGKDFEVKTDCSKSRCLGIVHKDDRCGACSFAAYPIREKLFTLADMIECWEAAKNMPDGDYWKKKYFKSKGINIDDQGK